MHQVLLHQARRKAIIIALEESCLKYENERTSAMAAIPKAKCEKELAAIAVASRAALAAYNAIHRELEALEAAHMVEIRAFEAANAGKVIDELKAR